jgi:predicted TIM-barrel fold metal-dependent hydrolase
MSALPMLSLGARALVERTFADLDGHALVDNHVHIVGLGAGGSGAYANPKMFTWRYPVSYIKASTILNASKAADREAVDQLYIKRLLELADGFPLPLVLAILAFDYHYTKEGGIDLDKSEFYVPDEYVLNLAKEHPEHFIPVVSIHPYAPDALRRLEEAARAGARLVKWLPNAQGMDPLDPDIDPYYRMMARHGMALLCHTGWEMSVSSDAQRLGSPLRLRRPLDLGVTVIMAHVGNNGINEDIDNPGKRASNCSLAIRMLDDPRYQGRLFADIAMITQATRPRSDLKMLLERSDLHPRLINGSDYPLPAIGLTIWPYLTERAGLITGQERHHLAEIRRHNPLLFDFVLKRALRHPKTGAMFPASMFTLP